MLAILIRILLSSSVVSEASFFKDCQGFTVRITWLFLIPSFHLYSLFSRSDGKNYFSFPPKPFLSPRKRFLLRKNLKKIFSPPEKRISPGMHCAAVCSSSVPRFLLLSAVLLCIRILCPSIRHLRCCLSEYC